jgi:hypothetical protein
MVYPQGTQTYTPLRMFKTENQSKWGFEADLWAFGCTIMELLIRDVFIAAKDTKTQKKKLKKCETDIDKYVSERLSEGVEYKSLKRKIVRLLSCCNDLIKDTINLEVSFTLAKTNAICDELHDEMLKAIKAVSAVDLLKLSDMENIKFNTVKVNKKLFNAFKGDKTKIEIDNEMKTIDIGIRHKYKTLFPSINDEIFDDMEDEDENATKKLEEDDLKQLEPVRKYYGKLGNEQYAKNPRWYKFAKIVYARAINNEIDLLSFMKGIFKKQDLTLLQVFVCLVNYLK